jgi:hypothetical protein
MYMMKTWLGPVVVVALLVAVVGAGSASAANWDPANTTLTAHATLTLRFDPSGVTLTCTYHSGLRSAGGADAFTTETGGTTPAPPTFSGCTNSIGWAMTVTTASAWTLTATSTTAVDVTNANVTITISPGPPFDCHVTMTGASIGATWNNATSTLTPGSSPIPISESGLSCPGDTSLTFSGSVVVPGASIT